MKYRTDKHGDPVSILGYGCMRFTRKGTGIDLEKAEKELLCAYEAGVNYYDTAYLYPGSEAAVGEIFARNGLREKVKIATKLPQYLVRKAESIDKYFGEELSRLIALCLPENTVAMTAEEIEAALPRWENNNSVRNTCCEVSPAEIRDILERQFLKN